MRGPLIQLPEPPSANRWWRTRVIPATRGKPAMASTYLSPEAAQYKKDVAAGVASLGLRCITHGPVTVEITWHRAFKAGDLDKRLGVVLDALQDVLYRNDAQVTRIVANRVDSAVGIAKLLVRVYQSEEANLELL